MDAKALNGGQLRIGASDTICRYYLVPYLKEFHEHFPNVHIKVTNATSARCVDLLENELVDLIVTNSPNPRNDAIHNVRKVREFHDVFIATKILTSEKQAAGAGRASQLSDPYAG